MEKQARKKLHPGVRQHKRALRKLPWPPQYANHTMHMWRSPSSTILPWLPRTDKQQMNVQQRACSQIQPFHPEKADGQQHYEHNELSASGSQLCACVSILERVHISVPCPQLSRNASQTQDCFNFTLGTAVSLLPIGPPWSGQQRAGGA